MSKLRECFFSPLITDEKGTTNEPANIVKRGYFEYWGQSTVVSYQMVGESYIPIIQNVVIGICHEGSTGKVFESLPSTIKFIIKSNE
jgi:hypothetical protein